MSDWSEADIPSQTGRLAVVTGVGGLGFETARALARAGATVVLAGRSEPKGRASLNEISARVKGARVRFELLDLASLASVVEFARRLASQEPALDLLVNNAGVMAPPRRRTTADGFELQLGTNHLGHFALTLQLLPLLRRGRGPRVVNVSSGAAAWGTMRFDDLQWEKRYNGWRAYSQSKLANLLFTFELQRRSDLSAWGVMSNAAHPGYARTELIPNGPGSSFLGTLFAPFVSQSPAQGALPQLFAATSPDAKGGGYYGPAHRFHMVGPPVPVRAPGRAHDLAAAARLWEVSEQLTQVRQS
jgi:NAD(P)-dependent dehydrogenase (short-subunit alcohol dehydrogenase family)